MMFSPSVISQVFLQVTSTIHPVSHIYKTKGIKYIIGLSFKLSRGAFIIRGVKPLALDLIFSQI